MEGIFISYDVSQKSIIRFVIIRIYIFIILG